MTAFDDPLLRHQLHDATFLGLSCTWGTGDAEATFRSAEQPMVRIRAGGVQLIHLSRTMPWGPSESVNTAQVAPNRHSSELVDLTIELQSGDVITIVASRFTTE